MGELSKTTALLTGAAQGIGLGIALELAKAGSKVVLADRALDQARVAAEEIRRLEEEALAVFLDVTDERSVDECIATAIGRFQRIDILVNNAGVHCERLGQASTVDQFKRCFDVNLYGAWRMTQALVPHFKANGSGKIINIASINGRKPWAETPAYSASKAALINLTQSLATTLGPDRINVNAVCPGGVMTRMAERFTQDRSTLAEDIIRSRTLKRALEPKDIGCAVVFFASARARNITGQALNVDGGTVMN
jgi:meso-butanediol dehydrogenase/(S,S)-butanediol dehydrogenase/diacetyl reductase